VLTVVERGDRASGRPYLARTQRLPQMSKSCRSWRASLMSLVPKACGQQAPFPSDHCLARREPVWDAQQSFDRQDVIGRPSPQRPQPKYHCRMADAPHRSRDALPIGPDRTVDFDSAYEGTPPWDIGHPQPAFLAVARSGALGGRVLDVGCGTGEHALMAAELGFDATGIDFSPKAIRLAENKARERSLDSRFLVADALELESCGGQYDTVLDCGLFHVFDDRDRARFVRSLSSIVVPDGHYFMLCFSDQQPGDWGPRRVSKAEIQSSFADGWRVVSVESSRIEITIDPEGAHAWLAVITRT
jgi:2-polyprenyl-3-methyl-5-hydroxy-6-metoxy-1,4-benzoquinol methylase